MHYFSFKQKTRDRKSAIISFLLTVTICSAVSAAGGVSDGGGGTTRPQSADPEWIVGTAIRDSAKMLIFWLNAEKANHFRRVRNRPAEESPTRVLFESNQDVFELVRKISIELRMSEPCYDRNNNATDGSIHGVPAGSICLSPFSMAPKLNDMNYHYETAALIMHEISHLLGASEAEATKIQQAVIYDLGKIDFLGTLVELELLAQSTGRLPLLQMEFRMVRDALRWQQMNQAEVRHLFADLARLRDDLQRNFLKISFLSEPRIESFDPQFIRAFVVQRAVCNRDEREDTGVRQMCEDWLAKAFAGQPQATTEEIGSRTMGWISDAPIETVRFPGSIQDIQFELDQIDQFLSSLHKEFIELNRIQFAATRRK